MAALKMLFKGVEQPAPKDAPPPPERTGDETAALIAKQRAEFFGGGEGRSATDLSGGKRSAVSRLLGDTGA